MAAAHAEGASIPNGVRLRRAGSHLTFCCVCVCVYPFRLLDAVSLDHALEDAYYLLDRALQDDRLDLASYTKQIRALSRKQFYARCLVSQIQSQQQVMQAQSVNAVAAPPPAQLQQQQPQQQAQASQPMQSAGAHHYAGYEQHAGGAGGAGSGGAGQLPQQNPQARVYGGASQQPQPQYPVPPHNYSPQLQVGPPVVNQQQW